MNEETREDEVVENLVVENLAADVAINMVNTLQDEVDRLQTALAVSEARVVELESAPVVLPAGDDELRALAATVRTAQRNGHPDATTHLNTLLNALGAP